MTPGATTFTVAIASLVLSFTLAAVTVTVCAVDGAVKLPLASMVPPEAVQETPFGSLVVTVKLTVCPVATAVVSGLTETVTGTEGFEEQPLTKAITQTMHRETKRPNNHRRRTFFKLRRPDRFNYAV